MSRKPKTIDYWARKSMRRVLVGGIQLCSGALRYTSGEISQNLPSVSRNLPNMVLTALRPLRHQLRRTTLQPKAPFSP